ncbi:cytochrome b [Acetobacteraceae bacterium]|nr:cytochrome b [Acetobacteraceae bacterium]
MNNTLPNLKFSPSLRVIHSLMALCILFELITGLIMALDLTPYFSQILAFHRPVGILLFGLIFLRIIVRFATKNPLLPVETPVDQKIAAYSMQIALYFLMLGMPLSGWLMTSAGGYPVRIWGDFILPGLVAKNASLHTVFAGWHLWLAVALAVLIVLHIMAAFYHKHILRDDIYQRMF